MERSGFGVELGRGFRQDLSWAVAMYVQIRRELFEKLGMAGLEPGFESWIDLG